MSRQARTARLVFPMLILVGQPQAVTAAVAGEKTLIWHVESLEGALLASRAADRPINPASLVKVATSLRALEVLGPDHRFTTRIMGEISRRGDVLDGDLIVRGGGDPDFQVENAFLVARALNDRGIDRVLGRLRVDGLFWLGWENGSAGRLVAADERALQMAERFRQALDPELWDRSTGNSWREFQGRHGATGPPPSVAIVGGVGTLGAPVGGESRALLATHISNPLVHTLRRFNAWSNNDLERLEASLGSPVALASWLGEWLPVGPEPVLLETLSGLGRNRMTTRQVVALLRAFGERVRGLGLGIEDVLPTGGCGPGTLRGFPQLRADGLAGAVVAKTGTLTTTDGGVVVLAGFARTVSGDLIFCVVGPQAGRHLQDTRLAVGKWVANLLDRHGGARPHACPGAPGHSDDGALAVVTAGPTPPPVAVSGR